MQTTLILAAAGPGTRLGAVEPKAFVALRGVPLFGHSLRAVLTAPSISRAIVVVPSGHEKRAEGWVESLGPWRCRVDVVPGGTERQDSVANGLRRTETDFVAVHDAARPFIDPEVVERAIRETTEHGACIVATPATDTLKKVDSEGAVVETIPREKVWLAQTPQIFRTEILREAHTAAAKAKLQATDESALVERLGYRVRIVAGNPENRKITTAEDLRWAEWLLERRSPR